MAHAYGLEVTELPDGYTPLDVIGAIKVLNDEGEIELWGFQSDNLTYWEALGILTVAIKEYDQHINVITFVADDDDGEDGDDGDDD